MDGRRGPDTASRMFSRRFSCNGCHTRSVEAKESGVSFPGESKLAAERQSCVACHGKRYDLMLDDWVRESRNLVADMERIVGREAAVGACDDRQEAFPGAGARRGRAGEPQLPAAGAGRTTSSSPQDRPGRHEQVTRPSSCGARGRRNRDPRLTVGVLRHLVPLPRDAVGQGLLRRWSSSSHTLH